MVHSSDECRSKAKAFGPKRTTWHGSWGGGREAGGANRKSGAALRFLEAVSVLSQERAQPYTAGARKMFPVMQEIPELVEA